MTFIERIRQGETHPERLYRQTGDHPRDDDPFIGEMWTPELATHIVDIHRTASGERGALLEAVEQVRLADETPGVNAALRERLNHLYVVANSAMEAEKLVIQIKFGKTTDDMATMTKIVTVVTDALSSLSVVKLCLGARHDGDGHTVTVEGTTPLTPATLFPLLSQEVASGASDRSLAVVSVDVRSAS